MPVWKPLLVFCLGVLALLTDHSVRAETALAALDWQRPAPESNERDLACLALNIYWEARSESLLGQEAVASVTLNRVASPFFPDSVCAVVFEGEERGRNLCQFSWRCDGRADTPLNLVAWAEARRVAWLALSRQVEDPTDGALWYHADHVLPDWAGAMAMSARIGHHVFYGQRPRATLQAQRDRHLRVPSRNPGQRGGLAAASQGNLRPLASALRIDVEGDPTGGLLLCPDATLCARPPIQLARAPGAAIPVRRPYDPDATLGAADIPAATAADPRRAGLARVDSAIERGLIGAGGWTGKGTASGSPGGTISLSASTGQRPAGIAARAPSLDRAPLTLDRFGTAPRTPSPRPAIAG